MEEKIKVGMIVRYKREWCDNPDERKYLHLVKENCVNPCTREMTRWLIVTLNTNMAFAPTSVVDECMIEPTSFCLDDIKEGL